jgi:hypothetical protein
VDNNSSAGHLLLSRAFLSFALCRSGVFSVLFKDEEVAMKSLITTGVLIASLSLGASAAMAANTTHKTASAAHVSHTRTAVHVAARKRAPRAQLNVDIGQFIQGMLGGGPVPYANLIRDAERMPASRRSSGSSYSPSYDSSAGAPASCAACDSQAASDQEVQEIQQMNDTSALTASMAAAEEQNDAANAATLQTEINAGM